MGIQERFAVKAGPVFALVEKVDFVE